MSTNHTTNYDLNQWAGTDKLLRTEFNADNAKIDAALKANADAIALKADAADVTALETELEALEAKSTLQTIKMVTQAADGGVLTVDLSDLDWSQWRGVYFCLDLQGNGHYRISYGTYYDQSITIPISGKYTLVFWPMYQASASMGGILFGYSTPKFLAPGGYAYDTFSQLSLGCPEPTYTIKKGSKITVLGER